VPPTLRLSWFLPPHFDYPVGGLLVSYEYANRLAARGHTVTLIHGWGSAALAARYDVTLPDEVHPPERYWFPFRDDVRRLHVREFEPARLPPGDVALNAPSYFEPYPVHIGAPVLFFQGFGWLLPEHEEMALRHPGRKVGVSRWVCEELRARGVPEGDIVHLPNGVDPSVFRPTTPIEERPERVAMLWSEGRAKRSELGLAVLEEVRRRLPATTAVLFGVDRRPEHLPAWVDYLQLPTRQRLARDVYGTAAVFLCSSDREGFFLPGLEAIASGCALVTTDNGGVLEYAEDGATALVSPTGSIEDLASRVVSLLAAPKERIALAHRGLARSATFSWDESAARLERLLLRWAAR
jgi:glycosyltransferase involved in cell wall biosynthesis